MKQFKYFSIFNHKKEEEYLRDMHKRGWSYIQDYVGYSYFCKRAADMNGEESIFNDDDSRTAMMGRVYKGRVFPLVGIFCGCLLPQFILNIIWKNYLVSSLIGGVLAVYIAIFIICAVSHNSMKKK